MTCTHCVDPFGRGQVCDTCSTYACAACLGDEPYGCPTCAEKEER